MKKNAILMAAIGLILSSIGIVHAEDYLHGNIAVR